VRHIRSMDLTVQSSMHSPSIYACNFFDIPANFIQHNRDFCQLNQLKDAQTKSEDTNLNKIQSNLTTWFGLYYAKFKESIATFLNYTSRFGINHSLEKNGDASTAWCRCTHMLPLRLSLVPSPVFPGSWSRRSTGWKQPTAWIFGHWIILYDLVNPPSHRLHRPPAPVSDIPTTSPSLERHACRRRTRRTRRRRRWWPRGEGAAPWERSGPCAILGRARAERRARENRSAVQHDLGAIGEAPGQGSGGVNDQEI
jgi:hypothetical protein